MLKIGLVALVTLAAATLDVEPAAAAVTTERVTVSSDGVQADGFNIVDVPNGVASDDGRFVVFDSFAANLVPGDTNDAIDVFVRDRRAGTTERVSVSSGGVQGDGVSVLSAISGDGRYVVFGSEASNLVPGDTNGYGDIFLHDRQTGATERVSVSTAGSQANEQSVIPAVSDDGNRVAFLSFASDLVPGDTNGFADVFVRDRQAGTTVRVSVSSSGAQGNENANLPHISGDGEHVSFHSAADNMVPGDTNGFDDVFVRDLPAAVTERVSVATGGGEASSSSNSRSSMSDDGRFVGFESYASDLVASDTNGTGDAFVRDRLTGTTERVSVATGGTQAADGAGAPTLSDDGRLVAFPSGSPDLVAADTNGVNDIFVRDRQAGTTGRVSLTAGGAEANGHSDPAFISGDGRHVVFGSEASNLVAGDSNDNRDVFVRGTAVPTSDCTVTGTGGDDVLTGSGADDVICGLGGDDVINGGGGDDTLIGGAGDDRINGGGGDDTIDGGPGGDRLKGQGGDDVLTDRSGVDTVSGESGDDRVDVQDGAGGDTAGGGSGGDTCLIDAGDVARC
ncbi:hypothetical protein ACTI_67970 [Actinoplanes sp. OR16]|uniref:calcium-binding protein n=1 Tax=Actinoplanes sp. OR16 TaxID=946334 RepID=UPI000F714CCE|nr:calcium-binding protein [Actinoplanes sp. OR16]BBH70112.1 hypothetical protein ACTI_67970 [Actinoplanes sp. OR16]